MKPPVKLTAAQCRSFARDSLKLADAPHLVQFASKLREIAKMWEDIAQEQDRIERLSWRTSHGLQR